MAQLEPQFLEAPAQISAQELRTAFLGLQEGVFDAGDLKVTAGAGITVSVAAGQGIIDGDWVTGVAGQGRYRVALDAALNSANFDTGDVAAPSTNPRLDLVVAEVLDATWDSSGQRRWRLRIVPGTQTAGATLDNRNGAAALPNSCLLLADRHVTSAGVVSLRDRRPWAQGASFTRVGNGAADLSTSSGGFVNPSDTLNTRLESLGRPMIVSFCGTGLNLSAGQEAIFAVLIDGLEFMRATITAAANTPFSVMRHVTPGVGSHLFTVGLAANGGTAVLRNSGGKLPIITFAEKVSPFASNS